MPLSSFSKCEGVPDQPCPKNRCDSTVKLCQGREGDLMLCSSCEGFMFHNNRQLRSSNKEKFDDLSLSVLSDPMNTYLKESNMMGRSNEDNSGNIRDSNAENNKPVIQPLLAYIAYSMNSGTMDNIKKAVIGHFCLEQIVEAKNALWNIDSIIVHIGEKVSRKKSSVRSETEAHVSDIINAFKILDRVEKMPLFVIDYISLSLIPRSHPEELNNISLCDRLNQMEERLKRVEEISDKNCAENLITKDTIDKLVKGNKDVTTLDNSQEVPFMTYSAAVIKKPIGSSNITKVVQNNTNNSISSSQRRSSVASLSSDKMSESDQPFEIPAYHKRQQQKKRNIVVGKATNRSGLKGAPEPMRDIFVFRLDINTTKEDVEKHVKDNNCDLCTVSQKSHPEAKFKSFKVTVPVSHLNRLMDPEIWPLGVGIRRFRMPRENGEDIDKN